jgi:hypothetical protein
MTDYPRDLSSVEALDRNYQDVEAVVLYKEAGASRLVSVHSKIAAALEKQAEKLEQFFSTPFTDDHARTLEASTAALVAIEAQLERWHHLIYPNQRPTP